MEVTSMKKIKVLMESGEKGWIEWKWNEEEKRALRRQRRRYAAAEATGVGGAGPALDPGSLVEIETSGLGIWKSSYE